MISENFKEKQMVNLLTNQHPLSKKGQYIFVCVCSISNR